MGMPFFDVTLSQALSRIDSMVAKRKPAYLLLENLSYAGRVAGQKELQRICVEADMVLCSDPFLQWASRFTSYPLRNKISTSQLLEGLLQRTERKSYRLFFLSSNRPLLEQAISSLKATHPTIPAPRFLAAAAGPLHELDNKSLRERIQEARPDLLIVDLDSPLQEQWLYLNYRSLGVPCCLAISGAMAWLAHHREPLTDGCFRRFFSGKSRQDLFLLLRQSFLERRAIGGGKRQEPLPDEGEEISGPEEFELLHWGGVLDGNPGRQPQPSYQMPFAIDLSGITAMDSAGLGMMLRIVRRAWAEGTSGCFLSPAEPVLRVVDATKLHRILLLANSLAEARAALSSRVFAEVLRPVLTEEDRTLMLTIPPTLSAENSSDFAETVAAEWASAPTAKILILDLAATTFVDSSGLGFLVRCRRLTDQREGTSLHLINLRENLCNLIRVARLEEILLKDSGKNN